MLMCEKQALIDFDLMALKLSRKYSKGSEFDDLYQIAKISIIEAVRSFDKNRGAKLSTHVFSLIMFNLRNYNTRNRSIIYQPSYSSKTIKRIEFDNLESTHFNEDHYSEIDFKVLLEAAMDSLTAKQREILKLKYIDGFTITEIAELLKCSHQNVSKLNSSAINSMQKALEL